MKKRTKPAWIFLIVMWAILIVSLVGLCSCTGRSVSYYHHDDDGNLTEIKYKSSKMASDEKADSIIVKTPNDWIIGVFMWQVDNDSFGIEVDPLTKKVRLTTESEGE